MNLILKECGIGAFVLGMEIAEPYSQALRVIQCLS